MNTHELIDRFVEVAEGAGADFSPIQRAPWIDALEAKLGLRLRNPFIRSSPGMNLRPSTWAGSRFTAIPDCMIWMR